MRNFIFGFVLGGVIGSSSTYFIAKQHFKKLNSLEIEKMRKHYKERYCPKNAKIGIKDDPKNIVKNYISDEERENIIRAELEHPSDEDDAPEEYYEDEVEDIIKEKEAIKIDSFDKAHRRNEPCIIPSDSFGEAPGYDEKQYTYYTKSKTITDENDQIVDDELYLFGTCLDEWKEDDDETESIFIRNFNISTDFEITKFFGPYEP